MATAITWTGVSNSDPTVAANYSPAQVPVINEAFVPGGAELERANRIVALFAENPGAGVLNLDGEMIDRPHLVQARRIVALAGKLESERQGS